LVEDDDGWLELDDDGVPLGRWTWDEDEEEWYFELFTPDVPLAVFDMPQTGTSNVILWLASIFNIVLLAGAGVITLLTGKHRAKRK